MKMRDLSILMLICLIWGFNFVAGHGLFYYMAQRHPISAIMPYMLMMPVFAVMFGVLVWGDRPGWRLLVGGSLVLLGIMFITLRKRRTVGKILR
jgi:drug/metabolite transporter (DMT)-like permease